VATYCGAGILPAIYLVQAGKPAPQKIDFLPFRHIKRLSFVLDKMRKMTTFYMRRSIKNRIKNE